ncbi:MAG: DUF4145 domain-containing protein [Chloroflexi bacterium]|nr:DUF4145 domain-containing protein [Chloroflexota bacterium]
MSGGRIAYPYRKPQLTQGIGEKVAFNYDQALRCRSAGALNTAAVMARATVESICQDLLATGRDLKERLNNLKESQKITPRLWEWADTIRLWGNDSVHDFPEITEEEADYIINFSWEVIEHVYVKEAEFQKIKHPKST